MKIILIGASGFIGSALLQEALSRQHQVTALVSNPAKIAAQANLTIVATNVNDTTALTEQLRGADAVISAFSGHAQADVYEYYVKGVQSIIAATKAAKTDKKSPRLLMVGGAGSLEVAPGLQVVDTPSFPEQWKATAEGARQALTLLKQETELNWTMLSPAAHIEPGQRTNQFRLGLDQLLVDAKGESHISLQDYAVAMLNELENPVHTRQRFSIAY
ncbi:NAD(P)-dependent oxidoreductase [Solimicrobium silvestre]|uniref:Putative NADH-flavin reductase n=1 Tax=Solimicrobium silvestre TaxID=2099400 RepID=A0A2S9H5F4_9BURK|nr:NAD(P)-dependent oxidoreductase [Solimicrobium silvestre]PRC95219.1 putative NADH-flavin reductase [Solimicrobium silvestre]